MTEYKETAMFNKKVFISFDYDNDKDIKENLVAQTRQSFCSYEIRDASIKASIDSKWKEEARQRIKNCDVVIVLCGEMQADLAERDPLPAASEEPDLQRTEEKVPPERTGLRLVRAEPPAGDADHERGLFTRVSQQH